MGKVIFNKGPINIFEYEKEQRKNLIADKVR